MTKHTYPGNFLRKRYYKVIRDFNLLGHCYLARYSDNNYPYINFEDFKQKLKYHFGASQIMTGISTNLLGRLKKYHLRHHVITPRRDSTEDKDLRRAEYFKDCNGTALRPIHEDLKYIRDTKFFGIRIRDVVETTVDVVIKGENNREIRTDKVGFGVNHTPKRCNFWHCDIVLKGTRGDNGALFNPVDLTHEKLNTASQVRKIAASLISLIEDNICIDYYGIGNKIVPWQQFSDKPIGKKVRKRLKTDRE